MQMSGIVTGTETMRVSVTNLLSEYMRITDRIDEILIEIEQLKKDNKTKYGKEHPDDNEEMTDHNKSLKKQLETLIKNRKKLRSDLNTKMDKLEKQVETIESAVEDTKKEAAKTNEDLVFLKSNMAEELIKQKDIVSKLEENHKKELQALETRLQMKQKEDLQNIVSKLEENHKKELQALEQRIRKDHSEEISSLSRRINLNRLELLQQFHTQDKFQIRAPLRRNTDYHKRCSLPVPLQLGEDELTKSLPLTFPRQRHISEASSESDSGYSHVSAITPDKERSIEFVSQKPRRPPSAQSYFPGGLQERVQTSVPFPGGLRERIPTPMPGIRQRSRSLTVPIQFPQFH